MIATKLSSSFRDPSGFLFFQDSTVYRQVNFSYRENYDFLLESGLYKNLVESGLLVSHQEVDIQYNEPDKAYKVIKPEPIDFISYPYEWCFSQLKEAALAMLKIQKQALEFGMSLKDCSAYNIQFKKNKPILIDTLSFEKYSEGKPWVAYKQFCQHFLAPLVLMSYKDIRLNQLLRIYIDGIPLDLASSLLPFNTYLKLSVFLHIHLHARSQRRFAQRRFDANSHKMNRFKLLALIDNLGCLIKSSKCRPNKTSAWSDYYKSNNYSTTALDSKEQTISRFLDRVRPKNMWDLGANTGYFSRIASSKGIKTLSFDMDPEIIEQSYLECIKNDEVNIFPILMDLTNPSPSIGWANRERMSFFERGPVDAVLALALIHHLAIANNLPFNRIAEFLNSICNFLIIEYIPKDDSQVQQLLTTRADIFSEYNQENFEAEFKKYFKVLEHSKLTDSLRTLYLMQKA